MAHDLALPKNYYCEIQRSDTGWSNSRQHLAESSKEGCFAIDDYLTNQMTTWSKSPS
jgi:hypothetical protein